MLGHSARRRQRGLEATLTLNSGNFVWPKDTATTASLSRAQLDALVLGLPWRRIGEAGVIRVL